MTGEGCPTDECGSIAYNYNDSTDAVYEGACANPEPRFRAGLGGNQVTDYFCLGAFESYPELCAPALSFCAITDPSAMPVVFENINGIIGFGPVPGSNLDYERQSFIY
jgi:hypothetical protein